ncbi:hypothetical protein CRUP_005304 [Coryphaenoides rupestris]|nr:hypothetical protein CRUP_005304 [Coryphaenoides rupestris]
MAARCKFFSLTETPENYTVVLDEEGFKELQPSEHLQVEGSVWLPLNVVSNGNVSSSSQAVGVTKIAKSVIAPLAEQHVSVFMLSTYQTDFILGVPGLRHVTLSSGPQVREKDLPVVISTLGEEFHIFREVAGESVPVHSPDAGHNGLQNNGKEALQTTVHPLLIPQNLFCVMSLDPDTLPSVATILIDVLFYSHREGASASPGQEVDCITFFSFSLIDGYVSLVMDTEAQRQCKFFSLTETPENYTVVLDEEGFKELQPSEHLQVEGSVWLPLNVVSNGNVSSSSQAVGVTKIAKSVIAPLAEQHVSVFMLSTYQTDFILGVPGLRHVTLSSGPQVREKDLPVVISTLGEEFHIFREVAGESVPVHSPDAGHNGLQNNGKEALQTTVHPLLIPQNLFCVMSLDPDTLPSVATILIDVLFYSHREGASASPGQEVDCITFFSFSLIDGYVSLVMDTEAQRQFPADLLFTSSSGELWRMVRIGGQPLGFGL